MFSTGLCSIFLIILFSFCALFFLYNTIAEKIINNAKNIIIGKSIVHIFIFQD